MPKSAKKKRASVKRKRKHTKKPRLVSKAKRKIKKTGTSFVKTKAVSSEKAKKAEAPKKKLPPKLEDPTDRDRRGDREGRRSLQDSEDISDEVTLDKTPMRIYLDQIEHIPLLTPEEESSVAQKIAQGGVASKSARVKMIRSNLRLVISIAKRYANIGLPFSDLVEEGNIGLMRAVDKFDYRKGYRFSTYASWWIKQAIMRALSNQGKTIRVPVYMYDVISKWRKVRDGLTQKFGRAPSRKEISDAMDIPIRKVKEIERIASQPSSLNAPVSLEGAAEVMDLVKDENAANATDAIQELFTSERIDRLLKIVDEREREILVLRFGLRGEEPKTLEEAAKRFNITRERVRQIEVAALKKIRAQLQTEEDRLDNYISQ